MSVSKGETKGRKIESNKGSEGLHKDSKEKVNRIQSLIGCEGQIKGDEH